jgi:CRP-like cAMP-binding protein
MNPTTTSSAEFTARFPTIAAQLGDHLPVLLKDASIQDIPAGRALIRDRMPVDFLYFVLDGSMGVFIENGGKSMRLGTVNPGEWLGEVSVLSGEFLASATIIPDTPARVMKLHQISFDKLIREDEVISTVLLDHFINLMAKRLRGPRADA